MFTVSYLHLRIVGISSQVRSYLWTSKNPDTPHLLDYQNEKSISSSEFDPQRSTKLLIHGYMSSKDVSPVVANLSRAFLTQVLGPLIPPQAPNTDIHHGMVDF